MAVNVPYNIPCLFFSGRMESALLVADATSIEMILPWLKIVEKMVPHSHLAFADIDGSELVHLERKIDSATRVLGHILPTATKFRKCIEIKNRQLCGPMKDAVLRALADSYATAQQYYQAPTSSDAFQAYTVMQDIIGGLRAASPAPKEGFTAGPSEATDSHVSENKPAKDVDVPVLKGSGEVVAKKRKFSEADSSDLPQEKARYGEAEEERRGKEKGRHAKQEGEEEEEEEVEFVSSAK